MLLVKHTTYYNNLKTIMGFYRRAKRSLGRASMSSTKCSLCTLLTAELLAIRLELTTRPQHDKSFVLKSSHI